MASYSCARDIRPPPSPGGRSSSQPADSMYRIDTSKRYDAGCTLLKARRKQLGGAQQRVRRVQPLPEPWVGPVSVSGVWPFAQVVAGGGPPVLQAEKPARGRTA